MFGLSGRLHQKRQVSYGSTNVICKTDYGALNNSLNQNPCLVYAWMVGSCASVFVQIDTLQNSTTYASPSSDSSLGLLVASNCTCGRVPYNLLNACAVCQGGNSVAWSNWHSGCSDSDVAAYNFTAHIPPGSALPYWAIQDGVDTFDVSKALADAQANSTAEFLPISTASSALSSAFQTQTASSSATSSPIPQEYTSGLSLLTGSVILAMTCAIFAGVVLAIFLFYRRKILHYGIEKMASNIEKERRVSLVLTLQPTLFASVFVIGIITTGLSTWTCIATFLNDDTGPSFDKNVTVLLAVAAWYTAISASYFLLSFQRTQADDAFNYYQRHGRHRPQSMVDLPVRTHPSRFAHTIWAVPTWIFWTVAAALFVSLPAHRERCEVYCTQVQALNVFALIETGLLTIILLFVTITGIVSVRRKRARRNMRSQGRRQRR